MPSSEQLLPSLDPVDDRHAVTIGGIALTRADLYGAATAVAERVAAAERVAILAEPSPAALMAVLGCLIAGVAAVPVPPDAGAAELAHIVADSRVQAWVGPPPTGTTLPVIPVRRHARSWHRYPEPDPNRIAFVVFTSGTTGPPKGVRLSRRAIAAGLDALVDAWAWTANDVLVHGLPLFHVHGLILGVLGPLRVGSPLIHTGKPTPQAYAGAPGTMYFGVPTVWSRIAEDPASARALADARLLISGSAPLPTPVFERIAELTGHAPVERYGMSETLITLSARADGERRPGWVGQPVAGVQTRLRDELGEPIPSDGESVGRLHVRGPMLFDGYLDRPDATAACWTADGWFDTGDVAVIDSAGWHRIVGRASVDLIKSGGYRIGAGEVEAALLRHPAVAEAAVIGVADDDLGQRIVGYVVLRGSASERELIDHVGGQLAGHKRPREIRAVTELPRNAMGKVQKQLLG
ncbi:acyl-CoA synthetase [Skermania piniformis]|uniref:acyl-CoA synthetase n=1 Tax=Skermania pinensis TaxID=39122 RepID=UPI000B037840|nr:acyl-CoA synthetase [Skermania piniformis]